MEDIWELWWVAVLVECTKQLFHKLLSQIGDTTVSVLVQSAQLYITHIMIVALRFHEQYTAFNLLGLCDDATYLQTQFIQSDTWAYQLMKAIPMR